MTVTNYLTLLSCLCWIAFIAALIWTTKKNKKYKQFDVLHSKCSMKLITYQSAVDHRHMLLKTFGEPIDQKEWDEATGEIIAQQFQYDEAFNDMKRQLEKI